MHAKRVKMIRIYYKTDKGLQKILNNYHSIPLFHLIYQVHHLKYLRYHESKIQPR